jgi:hypothetical protein
MQKSVVSVLDKRQARTRRLYQSTMATMNNRGLTPIVPNCFHRPSGAQEITVHRLGPSDVLAGRVGVTE